MIPTPRRARDRRTGSFHVGFTGSTKNTMARPANTYTANAVKKMVFAPSLEGRYPAKKLAGMSARYMSRTFVSKIPGKYLTCKPIM